jgi:hypothetical protein
MRDKSEASSILIIFFDIKRIVHKEFFLAVQTVNSVYYCDVLLHCVKMCEDFAPNFSYERTGCCITTTHRLTLPFSQGNFWPKQHDSPHTHPTFHCFADGR